MRYPNVCPRPSKSGAIRTVAVLVAVVVALFATMPVAAQGAASVSVTPTPAVAGQPVTVSGFGFAPGEMVTVEFGGETIASGYADDEGYFESVGVIPATMPEGEHPLDVNGDMGSYGSVEVAVAVPAPVTPTTEPPPPEPATVSFSDPVPAGTSTVVSGSGFGPGEVVTIEFGGLTVGHTVASDIGDWSLSIAVDSGMPVGGHPIDVTGDAGSFVTGELVVAMAPPTTTIASDAGSGNTAPTTTVPSENTSNGSASDGSTSGGSSSGGSASDGSSSGGSASDGSSSGGSTSGGSASDGSTSGGSASGDSGSGDGSSKTQSEDDPAGADETGEEVVEEAEEETEFELGIETPLIARGFAREFDSTRTRTSGAGGVPWGPISGALVLVAAALAFAATRVRPNCDPEEAAYAAADAAYDPAKRAFDYYQAEYEHYRGVHAQLALEADNPLPPPVPSYGGETAESQAAAQQVFEEQQAEWQMLEERAERARHNLDGAREAMETAEAERDEAEAALTIARETLEAARIALMDCAGCAPPPKADAENGGGSTSLPPSVGSAPPSAPATCLCTEGDTKTKTERTEQFRVLAGDIDIDVPTADWAGASTGGSIGADALGGLDAGALEDLFSDLDNRPEAVVTGYTIPTKMITVKYTRVFVCQGGGWVATEQTNRVQTSKPAPPITFRQKSKDARRTARMVGEAQAHVDGLEANAEAAADAMAQ